MTTVAQTLADRGSKHGNFTDNSLVAQCIKEVMRQSTNWRQWRLAAFQKEALDMIAHKIGRILAGDPNYVDHWHDIQGYAKLVEDRLNVPQAQDIPPKSKVFTQPTEY